MVAQSGWRAYVPIGILFTINLLNYMDRYTIAGVLDDIQTYYDINDAMGGLIQTIFMAFYIVFSPTCGFLGDRYNRKWIMVVGITLWIIIVLSSTFVPSNMFWLFLVLRGMVGIGEASYAIISPSVIADMYTGLMRSRMLMIFYFATPFGSGLGFIIGSEVDTWTGHWQWGVRVTSVFGIICVMLIVFFIEEPERGRAERDIGEISKEVKNTGYLADLWAIVQNPTYMSSTFGYTALVFGVGTLSWWMPTAIEHKDAWKQGLNSTSDLDPSTKSNVNLIFGVITCVAGIIGVSTGTLVSNWMSHGVGPFRHIQTKRSDAIICCVGAIIGIPTMAIGIWAIDKSMITAWIMIFICCTALSFNWATNVDMLMSVVIPSRRNTANAFQILISHLLGDGSGPYILGAISDWIRGDDDSPYGHFHSLTISFYLADIVLVLGAVLFGVSALTVIRDQRIFAEEMGAIGSPTSPIEVDEEGMRAEVESIDKPDAPVRFEPPPGYDDVIEEETSVTRRKRTMTNTSVLDVRL